MDAKRYLKNAQQALQDGDELSTTYWVGAAMAALDAVTSFLHYAGYRTPQQALEEWSNTLEEYE